MTTLRSALLLAAASAALAVVTILILVAGMRDLNPYVADPDGPLFLPTLGQQVLGALGPAGITTSVLGILTAFAGLTILLRSEHPRAGIAVAISVAAILGLGGSIFPLASSFLHVSTSSTSTTAATEGTFSTWAQDRYGIQLASDGRTIPPVGRPIVLNDGRVVTVTTVDVGMRRGYILTEGRHPREARTVAGAPRFTGTIIVEKDRRDHRRW